MSSSSLASSPPQPDSFNNASTASTSVPPPPSTAPPPSHPPPSYPLSAFHVGQRVQVDHPRGPKGTIRYIGPLHTHSPSLSFIGLEYDPPTPGKHDGSHAGRRYFSAPPATSLFIRHERLLPGRPFDAALRAKYEAAQGEETEEKLSLTAVNEGKGKVGRRQFDVEVQFVGVERIAQKIAHGLPSMQFAGLVDGQVSEAGDAQAIAQKIPSQRPHLRLSTPGFCRCRAPH